jgi:hypothetical protein
LGNFGHNLGLERHKIAILSILSAFLITLLTFGFFGSSFMNDPIAIIKAPPQVLIITNAFSYIWCFFRFPSVVEINQLS